METLTKTTPDIKITPVSESRVKNVDFNNLPFGQLFSDHIFVADYIDGKWQNAEIKPFDNLSMHPASNVLHYGQAIFEGMKAFKTHDGKPVIFRLDEHAKRFNTSARRMCMAEVPTELFEDAIKQLVSLDRDWIPTSEGSALYLRPFMIGTDGFLGVKPSSTFKFMVFCCPVGPYYPKPVNLLTADKYVRAVKGGVGEAKAAGNYAAAMLPTKIAHDKGYDQILWMDAVNFKHVQEAGTMNIFFVINDKIITPATSGAILKGITRKSFIEILKDKGANFEERDLSIDEIIAAHEKGELKEIFGSGTAAVVSNVASLTHKDLKMELPPVEDSKVASFLKQELHDIRTGVKEDKFGWLTIL